MKNNNKLIGTIEKCGKQSRGKTLLLKHLNGERLTRNDAILACCCACMGYYADGLSDCKIKECSLYPYMPYKGRA